MVSIIKTISKWIPLGTVSEISVVDLNSDLNSSDNDIQILDVRTRLEWKSGHIPGSLNIPITQLNSEIGSLTLDKSKPVVTICLSAHRSIPAVRALQEAGYQNVKQLSGGMIAWNKNHKHILVKA